MSSPAAKSLFAGYRFPAEVISQAVWLYFRFPLRDPDETWSCLPGASLMQGELPVGVAQLRRTDQGGGGDTDGMQWPVDLPLPEVEEAGQLREERGAVQLLPNEGLQHRRV